MWYLTRVVHYYYILSLCECKAEDTPFNPAQMLPILAPTSDQLPSLAEYPAFPGVSRRCPHKLPFCCDAQTLAPSMRWLFPKLCGRWYKRPIPLFPRQKVKQRSWDQSICYKTPWERSLGVCWLPVAALRHTGFLAVEPGNRIKTPQNQN